jgi:hypothetical protein
MNKQINITVRADADKDDCLTDAADRVRIEFGLIGWDLDGWNLSPRWTDDRNRDTVTLTLPKPKSDDAVAWDVLRALEGYSGSHH